MILFSLLCLELLIGVLRATALKSLETPEEFIRDSTAQSDT